MSINHDFVLLKPKGEKKVKDTVLGKPSISLISGATGTGKTQTLLNEMLALSRANEFERALYVTGNRRDKTLKFVGDDVEITHDPQRLLEFIEEIKQDPEPEENKSIIIMDDIQGNPQFNILKRSSDFLNFSLSHRHYHTWMILTAQTYPDSFHNVLKKQASLIFIFPPRNDAEEELILKQIGVDKIKLKRAFMLAGQAGDHVPVYINKQKPKARLFLGFKSPLDL